MSYCYLYVKSVSYALLQEPCAAPLPCRRQGLQRLSTRAPTQSFVNRTLSEKDRNISTAYI